MQNPQTSRVIVLAAGGTGGHIFPAEALAEAMLARGYAPHLITDHRFHQYNKSSAEGLLARIPIHTIRAGSLGGGLMNKCKSIVQLLQGTMQARRLLKKLQPVAVVGFGGYPSFPTMFAGVLGNYTTILHEQNAVLGKVNRLLGSKVNQVALSYPDTQKMPAKLRGKRTTGNPVRAAIQLVAKMDYPSLSNDGILRLLVIGGSQGASVFSDVVPQALAKLPENLRARIRLDQQCRPAELEQVKKAYAALNMQVDLAPFFTDVAARLAAAHLVICRAGASTVAELMCAGRPALLVPLPQATDNHQYFNAAAIEDVGAGWVVTQDAFTPEMLASKLETLLHSPQRLNECAAQMHALGNPKAADALADAVLAAANIAAVRNDMEKAA